MSDELLDAEVERVIHELRIPPCPDVLNRLLEENQKEYPDLRRIASLISSDVGLGAALLKTVNSPFYGLRTKATSIQQATSFLGIRNVLNLVTGLLLKGTFKGLDQVSLERFWDASSSRALVCSYLTRRLPGLDRDLSYTFGLFQDCAIPVLVLRFPDYKDVLAEANEDGERAFTAVEEARKQTNHATVGYLLARSWHLPQSLCQAIRHHHDYGLFAGQNLDHQVVNLIAIGLMAERIIQLETGKNKTVEWAKGGTSALRHFGLEEEEFAEMTADAHDLLSQKGG